MGRVIGRGDAAAAGHGMAGVELMATMDTMMMLSSVNTMEGMVILLAGITIVMAVVT